MMDSYNLLSHVLIVKNDDVFPFRILVSYTRYFQMRSWDLDSLELFMEVSVFKPVYQTF